MLAEFQRVPTSEDRSLLMDSLGPPRSFWSEWGRRLSAQMIMLAFACVVVGWITSWGYALLIAAFYVGFEAARGSSLAATRAWQEIRVQVQRRKQIAAAIACADAIRVTRVESETVVAVPHDFGTHYLFDLGDGRWFAFEAEGPCDRWPNSAFEVLRLPNFKGEFGPICDGRQLPVRQVLEFKGFNFESIPDDGIIAGGVEGLLTPPPEAPSHR